jgi:hypothetical protein
MVRETPFFPSVETTMRTDHLRRLAVSLLFAGAVAACSSGGVDGKYFNTVTGAFAFELKGGKVLDETGAVNPMFVNYTIRGDSVFIVPPGVDASQALVLGIKAGGVLDAGPVGSLKKQ